ncbi:MAG TPA: histone deacetylase [Vicinamibacterales bacterium]|nr:histone deacetylase [Vicinamibacterales bacterium]
MMIISSTRFTEHVTPPGHPESPERAEMFSAVAEMFKQEGADVREPRPATHEELARVHTAEYLDRMTQLSRKSAMIDEDTFTSPETIEIALLAAGAAIDAAMHAWKTGRSATALVRPPGHHAEPDRAMGFCFYNNIALAAAALRAAGANKVAIVDIDVHHGNGTQNAFYADRTVLFISSHQYPFYPGTGAAHERGTGDGEGYTINIPLPAGADDLVFQRAYSTIVIPALERFAPDVILVSAGFDAHELDPLGRMRLTTDGYMHLLRLLHDAAARLCSGRIAMITEGGYHLGAVRDCLERAIRVLN